MHCPGLLSSLKQHKQRFNQLIFSLNLVKQAIFFKYKNIYLRFQLNENQKVANLDSKPTQSLASLRGVIGGGLLHPKFECLGIRKDREIYKSNLSISAPPDSKTLRPLCSYLLATPLFSVHVWRRHQHVHYTVMSVRLWNFKEGGS